MRNCKWALACLSFSAIMSVAAGASADPQPNWNGPWIGAFVGASQTEYRKLPFIGFPGAEVPEPTRDKTASLTAAIGWNFQYGQIVLGPVLSATQYVGGMNGVGDVVYSSRTTWGAGGRLGFLVSPNLLIYGTAGLSMRHQSMSALIGGSFGVIEHPLKTGVSLGGYIGAGAEYAFESGWSAIVEYRYTDHGTVRWRGPITIPVPNYGSVTLRPDFTQFHAPFSHTVQLGVAYRW